MLECVLSLCLGIFLGWWLFRPRKKMVNMTIRRLNPGYRTGFRWKVTIDGRPFEIKTINELPERERELLRNTIVRDVDGLHELLGKPIPKDLLEKDERGEQ